MTGTLVGLGILLALLAWFFWPKGRDEYRRPQSETEAAEEEVREAADEESVRDWGPGVQKPPI